MDIDFKTISVVVGIASALLGILYKVVPKRSDKLRKNLELLKLAQETKVNHLPLMRHVNSIIHREYVHEQLSIKQKSHIISINVLFAVALSFAFLGVIGVIISWLAQTIFGLTDEIAGYILAGFVAFGFIVGVSGGLSDASKELKEVEKDIDKNVRHIVEEDEKELIGDGESEVILNPNNTNNN